MIYNVSLHFIMPPPFPNKKRYRTPSLRITQSKLCGVVDVVVVVVIVVETL